MLTKRGFTGTVHLGCSIDTQSEALYGFTDVTTDGFHITSPCETGCYLAAGPGDLVEACHCMSTASALIDPKV